MSPVMTSHPAIANKEILNPYLHLARCPLEYFPGRKRMNTTLPCRATWVRAAVLLEGDNTTILSTNVFSVLTMQSVAVRGRWCL